MKRFNKTNGMYALLVAVATMIGITVYGSCSADEDYGDYSSRDELFTLADGEMSLRSEEPGTVYFQGFYIDSSGIAAYNHAEFVSGYHANITIGWSGGWTGNINNPRCRLYLHVSSIHKTDTEADTTRLAFDEFPYHYDITFYQCTPVCEWKPDDKLQIKLNFTGHILCYRLRADNDYSQSNPEQDYFGTKSFDLELTYQQLLSYCIDI